MHCADLDRCGGSEWWEEGNFLRWEVGVVIVVNLVDLNDGKERT